MSKAFLIILIILLGLFLLLYPFLGALIKDKRELADKTLEEIFPFFFSTISSGLFEGKGKITPLPQDPRCVNMMSTDPNCQNMIVHFLYGTGNMTIEVGYKYFHEELRFQHVVAGLRNASAFTQKNEANAFVEVARKKIYEHKINVVRLLHPGEVVDHINHRLYHGRWRTRRLQHRRNRQRLYRRHHGHVASGSGHQNQR